MNEIQSVQLELLKVCRDICSRYGITYFLFGDTLRGAVRKNAFLPEGTEAALLMPAADLKNFCAYFAREAPKGLFLSNMHTEKACCRLYTRIQKDGTTEMPRAFKDMPLHFGIGVDLYPYYPVEVGKAAQLLTKIYLFIAEKLLCASRTAFLETPSFLEKLIVKIPEEKRLEFAKKLAKKLEKGNKKSMQVCVPYGGAEFFWREALSEEETFSLMLEGEMFRVPDKREVFLNMTRKGAEEDVIRDAGKGKAGSKKAEKKKAKR